MFQINFPATPTVDLDSELWKACAGTSVPEVGTLVYYFPEGHAEQCDSPPALALPVWPIFPCRVVNIRYLADQVRYEVFAAVMLQPVVGSDFRVANPVPSTAGRMSTGVEREGSRIDSYSKLLSRSDTSRGRPLVVPDTCAQAIFPPLNFERSPTGQNLMITDVMGVDWVFEHVYRNRHLLTSSKGWMNFVKIKELKAGDTVIFIRDNSTGRLYIAIRRLSPHMELSARLVEEALQHAEKGKPFQLILYPRNGLSEYVVSIGAVERALSLRWTVGMPVKMPVASDDSGSTWLRGQVSLVTYSLESGQWRGSPWKMLQVTWIETKAKHLQNVKRVSPWQVEYTGPPAHLQPIHPPMFGVRKPAKFGWLGYSMVFCFFLAVLIVYIMSIGKFLFTSQGY